MGNEESGTGGLLTSAGDLLGLGVDSLRDVLAMGGEAATPWGALAAAGMHSCKAVRDVAKGDDHGGVKEGTEAIGAPMGMIPGVGLVDVAGGMLASDVKGDGATRPETLSGLAGDWLAGEVVGEDAEPAPTSSTMGNVGGVVGGMIGASLGSIGGPMGFSMGAAGGAGLGRGLGNDISNHAELMKRVAAREAGFNSSGQDPNARDEWVKKWDRQHGVDD